MAIAAPVGMTQLSRLYAADSSQSQRNAESNFDELVKLGKTQLDAGQYDEAERTLKAVNSVVLTESQRSEYVSLVAEVKKSAEQQRLARREFEMGKESLKAGHQIEAVAHFKAAQANHYADDEVRQGVKVQLAGAQLPGDAPPAPAAPAVAQPAPKSVERSAKESYQLAREQYRKGDWEHAKQNFRIARDKGYKPSLFEGDAPAVYLARMQAREQAQQTKVVKPQYAADTTGTGSDPDALSALKATSEAEDLRHRQAVAHANELVRQAEDARRQNNLDRALDLYTQAANLDPNNGAAVQGRDNILTLTGRNPAPQNLGEATNQSIRARQEEITYQVQNNLDQARSSIADRNFANAQIAIDRARVAANADPGIFRTEDLRRFKSQIDQVELNLQQAEEEERTQAEQKDRRRVEEAIVRQHRQAQLERQRTIANLIQTSRQLTSQGRYREALDTVDQILILDPTNDYAVGVKPLLQDKDVLAEQRNYFDQRNLKTERILNTVEEKLIPYDDILRYPSDWPDISQLRDQTVSSERGVNKEDRAVQAQLDRTLPELNFEGVAFNDVIDFLRDVSGSNIFVNWKSLEGAGIDKNTPVTARLRNVKLSKALNVILDSVGGGQTKLSYTVDDGVITVSTQDDLSRAVITRVYDIRDLIINVPDFTDAPQFSLDAAANQGQGGGGGGGGGGAGGGGGQVTIANSLFANQGQQSQTSELGQTRQELVDAITKLIEDTVANDSWKDNGGSVGALRELQGQLIVTQTPENHRQLVNLLEQLRETRAIQVTVETRFLTVQRNFLEDVGVDLNFLFNLNNSWSNKFGTIPVTTPDSTFTMLPATGVPGSIGNANTTPTGLTTSATYLDQFQVQLMMRAVQASVNSTIVTAPRITLFNGQRAYMIVSTQRAYISNLTPVVSTGISSFQPTIGLVQSGVLLDVQATVSADRKYVTLTMRPQLSTLLDLVNFTFQQGGATLPSGAIGGGGIGGVGGIGFGAVGIAPSGTIQEPEIQITKVQSTVSIPDGGTLLIGGQTLGGEIEREIGVPVLSKIPFLKRLFTNRSMAKDEQVLLILVRPTIVIQKEIEQKQFPLLTSNLAK